MRTNLRRPIVIVEGGEDLVSKAAPAPFLLTSGTQAMIEDYS